MRNRTEHGFSRLTAISDAGSTPAASTKPPEPTLAQLPFATLALAPRGPWLRSGFGNSAEVAFARQTFVPCRFNFIADAFRVSRMNVIRYRRQCTKHRPAS